MRKPIIAGNWKMNLSLEHGFGLASEIKWMVSDEVSSPIEIILIPPFTHLAGIQSLLKGSVVKLGAQNCHHEKSGAYTGEISAEILKSVGVTYVLVGHSERRIYQNESNALLAKKIDRVLENGLKPIYCFGETLEQREAGNEFEINLMQIQEGLFHLTNLQIQNVILAYEPVWAIGTGQIATAQQCQAMHKFVRNALSDKYGEEISNSISILYGGSMKPNNANELLSCEDIDGGLIGGASLESRAFLEIIKTIG